MGLTLVTPAATSPVSLATVKLHCGVEDSSFDALLSVLLEAAVAHVQDITGLALGEQTWALSLDEFSDAIELPKGPVLTVDSVGYYDLDGLPQVVSPLVYSVDLVSTPQFVVRNSDAAWPDALNTINVVTVTFTTGYAVLPPQLVMAILMLVAHWFENRSAVNVGNIVNEVPLGFNALLQPLRRLWVCT